MGAFANGPLDWQFLRRRGSEFEAAFRAVDASGVAALQVRQFCLNGGGQARVCRTDPAGDIPAARLRQQGCDVPLAPDLAALSSADGMAAIAALREAAAQARALLVLDPPVDAQSVVGIQAWRANLAAALGELPDAAVYFP
jgi:hypothetical protein